MVLDIASKLAYDSYALIEFAIPRTFEEVPSIIFPTVKLSFEEILRDDVFRSHPSTIPVAFSDFTTSPIE